MYKHIRGSTFQFVGQFQNQGLVQNLTGFTIRAAIYDPTGTNLYGVLTVTILDAVNGIVLLTYPNTSAWPVGKARMDMTMEVENEQIVGGDPAYFRIGQNPLVG